MAHIDYYFSTLSPYTYLAGNRFETVVAQHGASVTYKPMDVIALFGRTGGTPPKDRHPNRQAYRLQELERKSKLAGLPLNLKPMYWPTNAAPSCFSVIAAQNAGGGDLGKLVHAFTRAVWAEEKDISQDDVIKAILEGAGFDPSLADTGLLEGAETYARNLDEAISRGAFGAPFYITDQDQRFWGHDRLDDLKAHLEGRI